MSVPLDVETVLEALMDMTDYKAFIEAKRAEGRLIDSATAEVTWIYARTLDPYGVLERELTDEEKDVGRQRFAARVPITGSVSTICRRPRASRYGNDRC
jgi:hypothetical protein